jgi:predicted Ser/Thr protein kinase/tetratricopeptide (TPR) repeat protein
MFEGKQIGQFKVEKELGSGAMGAVYKALDTRTNQYVAIKFIAPGLGENDRIFQRFEREAKMLQQLKHPNIVRRIGTGKYHKTPFYIMEYVEGKNLGQVLEERKYIPWDEVVHIGKQVASALHHAHSFGIIHRDLKPSNLMFTQDGTVKLTDFGIAKDLDAEGLTSIGCTVGTASYMSPEQCQGVRDLTHKSDLYSLGIVFYELLTGKKPFLAENVMDMFMMHVKGPFQRPSTQVMDIPVWLDTLVCQLMEKEPDKRPLNAAMVEQVLDEVIDKVETQKSVGAAVAGKVALRPKTLADRRAAETLLEARESRRKRRRKSKGAARLQTTLAAIGLGAAVLVLIGLLVFAFWPDGPKEQYLAAERLAKKGEALLESEDPEAAKEAWYDAERKLENITLRPNHPYAEKAQLRLQDIKAGMGYLAMHRFLQGKSDWGEIADETTGSKSFLKAFDDLLKNYPRDHKFVVRALAEVEPLQAPALLKDAKEHIDIGTEGSWREAIKVLRTLIDRYPKSQAAEQAQQEIMDWLYAWEEATEDLKKPLLAQKPIILQTERDAREILTLEGSDAQAAHERWKELAGRQPDKEGDQTWIKLAQQKAKHPPPAEKKAADRTTPE